MKGRVVRCTTMDRITLLKHIIRRWTILFRIDQKVKKKPYRFVTITIGIYFGHSVTVTIDITSTNKLY